MYYTMDRIYWSLTGCYVRALQRNKPIKYIWSFIRRNWLMRLWRLRRPIICCLQTGDPGKPVMSFSLSQKAWEPGELVESKRRKVEMFQFHQWGRKIRMNSSFHCLLFYSGSQWIEDPQLHLGGQFTLQSPPI